MNGSGSRPVSSPSLRRNFVVLPRRSAPAGRACQHFAQAPPELAIHADVDVRVHEVAHLGQVAAQRHHHVDLAADAFDEAADLGEVEGMLNVPYIGPRMLTRGARALLALLLGRHPALGHAELGEDPGHRAVGAFPLVLVDGARQEALDGRALRRHAPADHLGDGARSRRPTAMPGRACPRPASSRLRSRRGRVLPRRGPSRRWATRAAAARRCSAGRRSPAGSRSPRGRR
jgi:hypothetical protein